MRPLLFVLFALLPVSLVFSKSALEVVKTVEEGNAGVHKVHLGYRATGSTKQAFNVKIVDSLPASLDLVSGDLVLKAKEPTSEWTYNTYTVKANNKIQFTVEKPKVQIKLPPAQVSFTNSEGDVQVVETQQVSLVVGLVVPQGKYNAAPVVAFFTLILPVAAAVYAIPYYQAVSKAKNKKKR